MQDFVYSDKNVELKGYIAYPDTMSAKTPAVLIAPAWEGRNEFACEKARELARMGYVGFAIDMYGGARLGKDRDENGRLIAPFMEDRAFLRQRVTAAFNALKNLKEVDAERIAIMGFCFGGLCALDLARSGADLKGVISFHGLLRAPEALKNEKISAKILALHGHNDPMVNPKEVAQFQDEMTRARADWQLHIYSNTVHGFMNPEAHDADFGTVYNPLVAKRAWKLAEDFLTEIFVL